MASICRRYFWARREILVARIPWLHWLRLATPDNSTLLLSITTYSWESSIPHRTFS